MAQWKNFIMEKSGAVFRFRVRFLAGVSQDSFI